MSDLVYQNYSNKCKGWVNPSTISFGPQITSLSSYNSPAGSTSIITINGTNFYSYSRIAFGTLNPTVYFVNSNILQFYIPNNLPYGIYTIQVFNGAIGSNIVNYTLDGTGGLTKTEADALYLSKVNTDTSIAPLTTFNSYVSCIVTPTTGYNLCNKNYVDNTFSYIFNFSSNAFTNLKKSIIYNFDTTTTITKSNIKAKLDNYSIIKQVYTFGKQIPNRWVAGGTNNNCIVYSSDGINWAPSNNGTNIFSVVRGVAWNGQMWVAVGSGNNKIAYSSDGISWTPSTYGNYMFSDGYSVAWNGTMWVAVGHNNNNVNTQNTIVYSYDGIVWADSNNGKGIIYDYCVCVAWNGQMWVAGGNGGNGTNKIGYSYDGIVWAGSTNGNAIFTACDCVAWNGNMWVGGGINKIAYSYDGKTWTGVSISPFTEKCYGVAWNGKMWVAGGQGTNTIAYSYDGIVWSGSTNGNKIFNACRCVAWNGTMWVVVGDKASTGDGKTPNWIAYSYDGINWTGAGDSINLFINSVYGITFNSKRPNTITFPSNLWVAGSYESDNKIAYSYNGINWANSNNGNNIFTEVYGVASNETMWVAVGKKATNGSRIAYSYDGIVWNNSTNGNDIFGTAGWYVAWNGTMWVAGGQGTNTLAYSDDGISWTKSENQIFNNRGFGVASNGTMWVAVGDSNNTIAYSNDGKFWNNGNNIFGTIGWCVAWNGTMWVAGGQGNNTIAYSYDGKTWKTENSNGNDIFNACRCVAWNGTMWVAGGQKSSTGTPSTIAYSNDGIVWTRSNSGNLIFTDACLGVAWNGQMWVAGGDGTNSLAFSYDGINWTKSNSNPLTKVHCVGSSNSSSNGQVTISENNGSIVLNQYGNGFSQLDVVCDSYYNTGFTNCSIAINSTSIIN